MAGGIELTATTDDDSIAQIGNAIGGGRSREAGGDEAAGPKSRIELSVRWKRGDGGQVADVPADDQPVVGAEDQAVAVVIINAVIGDMYQARAAEGFIGDSV